MRAVAIILVLAVVVVVVLYAAGVIGTGHGETTEQGVKSDIRVVRAYIAVDSSHSQPIIAEFEKRTGIQVDAHYDTERTKTVGHVTNIITEQEEGTPRCDVFWNNEIAHTIRLMAKGYLHPYVAPNAAEIPDLFKDPDGHWTGFAARARILIVNKESIPDPADYPTSMGDFLDPRWKRNCTMARPETGTTLTHAAALFGVLGAEKAEAWLRGATANEILWVQSNGQTMKRTSAGAVAFGWTDTDDYNHAVEAESPVDIVYPDQGEGQPGTMLIPNTVCILKDAPHLEQAKALVDYLLGKEVEKALAFGRSRQIPVRPDVDHPPTTKVPGKDFRAMEVDWMDVGTNLEARLGEIRRILGLR